MPLPLSLFDLVSPYLLLGEDMGGVTMVLAALHVESWTVDESAEGSVIRGRSTLGKAKLDYIPPATLTLVAELGGEAADSGERDSWFDIRDSHIDFQLTVPREASAVIDAAPPGAAADYFAKLDAAPTDQPPSDYPNTNFTLDLLLTSVVLRPPMLKPALLDPTDGTLQPDPDFASVAFTLPRIKLRIAQPSGPVAGAPLTIDLLSLGASGLDDPGALGVADLVEMEPPYAMIGDTGVGFGFRGAMLDLSDGATPAAVLAQFGFDESWKGLYFPEIRLFVALPGMNGLALSGAATNLLIGFGDSPGVTGDFMLSAVEQGEGPLELSARFIAAGRPRPYGITFTDAAHEKARAEVPEDVLVVVDIAKGRTPYQPTIVIGGVTTNGRSAQLKVPAAGSVLVRIEAKDGSNPQRSKTLDVEVSRLSTVPTVVQLPGQAVPLGPVPAATLTKDSSSSPNLTIELVSQTDEKVRLVALPRDDDTDWTVNGLGVGSGAEIDVALKPGTSVAVVAKRKHANSKTDIDVFWHYDHPTAAEEKSGYGANPDNSHSTPALDELPAGVWSPGGDTIPNFHRSWLDALPAGAEIKIAGYASYEGDTSKKAYNQLLSERRARSTRALIQAHFPAKSFKFPSVTGNGYDESKKERDAAVAANLPPPPRNQWWRAMMTLPAVAVPGEEAKATLARGLPSGGGTTPGQLVIVPPPDAKAAETPAPPDWFHSASIKVRVVRGQFIAVEVDALIDFETGLESRMAKLNPPPDPPFDKLDMKRVSTNQADGLTRLQWITQVDPATDTMHTRILAGADPADRDGLLMAGWLADEAPLPFSFSRTYLGLTATLLPLLSNAVPPRPKSGIGAIAGDAAELAAVFGVPVALALSERFEVQRVILHGVEGVIEARPDGISVSYLFDVETALSVDLGLITIEPEHPLTVRYKAIGVRVGRAPGEQQTHILPVFDASRGYSIDVGSPGVIKVPDPLGKIMKVLGARMARTNPLSFEIDIGMSADLGVVTVDRARVRLPLDPPGIPELTALGVGIDVPGALLGHGSLELNEEGMSGSLDVTLRPIGLRIAAGLALNDVTGPNGDEATGVFVSLEVNFPVPIPLWTSGLGIYGFLGLFAMHYRRDTLATDAAGTLQWLKDNGGDATNPHGWTADYGHWGFGLGALLGTMDGGVLFNLKGLLLLELPGPNILLTMKARLLSPMPQLEGDTPSPLEALAVIDIDVDAGQLSIGLVFEYEIKWLLKLKVPVTAIFRTDNAADWHINLGEYPPAQRVQAKIFYTFDGSGYLMLSGNGLDIPKLGTANGFAVAAGLHVSLTWGPVPIGLYARVGGGMDALVGFDPFRFDAKLTLGGELRLFVVSIGAHTDLTVKVGEIDGHKVAKIDGDICGSVDCWFFEVEGCVGFHLGDDTVPAWSPPPLVQSLALMSRSPALVAGTGSDRPIDARLPPGPVPIDAIPVLMMVAPPATFADVLGGTPDGTPGGSPDGFVKLGNDKVRYKLKSVELTPSITGAQPSVWWLRTAPTDTDRGTACQLALLTWTPTAISKAIESSEWFKKTVEDRWGTACTPPAPPAPVLWTFAGEPVGPSEIGWTLDEGIPWPDPPDLVRSEPCDVILKVRELWRCGDKIVDQMRGIEPAIVEMLPVPCPVPPPPQKRKVWDMLRSAGDTLKILTGVRIGAQATAAAATDESFRVKAPRRRDVDRRLAIEAAELAVSTNVLSVSDMSRRLRAGGSLSRWDLQRIDFDYGRLHSPRPPRKCHARMLASPIFDDGRPVGFGNPAAMAAVENGWEKVGFHPSDLGNALRLETGGVQYARFWLLVRHDVLRDQRLVVRGCRADGKVIASRIVTTGDLADPAKLPKSWMDGKGPWYEPLSYLGGFDPAGEHEAVLVQLMGLESAAWIEIGTLQGSLFGKKSVFSSLGFIRPFYVGAVEILRLGEIGRAAWDESQTKLDQGVLEKALGPGSTAHALLEPGKTYTITAKWTTELPGAVAESHEASFDFITDTIPPKWLAPWVLSSSPEEGEQHVFGGEKIAITFATDDVARLWKAYGKTLQARVKAASFRQHDEPGTNPLPIDDKSLVPVKQVVTSPWEEAVAGLKLGCVAVDEERIRHAELVIPIDLDPLTDYVLAIESIDDQTHEAAVPVPLTIAFNTSAYPTAAKFAEAFQAAKVEHRFVAAGKLQEEVGKLGGQPPHGTQFETLLEAAGLDAMPLPDHPRIVVLWEQAGADPQPVAVMLDSSEAIWRSRKIPGPESDPETGLSRQVMKPFEWLSVVETVGGAAAASLVGQIVAAPGGQRGLAMLSDARGKRLNLALRHVKLADGPANGVGAPEQLLPIADIWFAAAPWEDMQP